MAAAELHGLSSSRFVRAIVFFSRIRAVVRRDLHLFKEGIFDFRRSMRAGLDD